MLAAGGGGAGAIEVGDISVAVASNRCGWVKMGVIELKRGVVSVFRAMVHLN